MTLVVRPTATGTIINLAATVAATETDPNTGNNTATVSTIVIPPPDTVGPVTSNVLATPSKVRIGNGMTLTATISDVTTGSNPIISAEYRVNSGPFIAMSAADGFFNQVIEKVSALVAPLTTTGLDNLCVRGKDTFGNLGGTACILVPVYPNGGSVSGGGTLQSPTGAFVANPTLTDTASFTFAVRYSNGATTPGGTMSYTFPGAGLGLSATIFDWLVVSGETAWYRGTGMVTINGKAQACQFLVAIVDGANFTTDRFRLKIQTATGLVYDTQPGAPDDTMATQGVTSGPASIVIR